MLILGDDDNWFPRSFQIGWLWDFGHLWFPSLRRSFFRSKKDDIWIYQKNRWSFNQNYLQKTDIYKKIQNTSKEKENKDEEAEEAEEVLDEGGIDEGDIEMVMEQAGAPRNKAVKALKENNNDVVQAIITLTE